VSVTARYPLYNAYASGDTFVSTRIQISVLDSWAAEDANISGNETGDGNARYRVRWNYTVGGAVVVADSYFDLVRYPSGVEITPLDVERMIPGWLTKLPPNHQQNQGATLVDEGRAQVRRRLFRDKVADQLIRDTEMTGWLTALKADEIKAYSAYRLSGSAGTLEQYTMARDRFNEEYAALVGVTMKLRTSDESGAARNVPAIRITRR
jgi:hypothetical protein